MKMSSKGVEKYDDVGGIARLKPGRYHVFVSEVNEAPTDRDGNPIEDRDGNAKCLIEFEALAGTDENCKGHRHNEFFATSEKSMPRLVRFAMCCGLLKGDQDDVEVDLTKAIGSQLIIELEEGNEYEDKRTKEKKRSVQVTYAGMWDLEHDEVESVPRGEMLTPEQLAAHRARKKKSREDSPAGGKKAAWGDLV